MTRKLLLLSLACLAVASSVSSALCADEAPPAYEGPLSALGISGGALPSDWTGPTGLLVDDFDDIGHFPVPVRATVEALKRQLVPLGVTATADFTYRRKSDPLEQITLRVFIFASEQACLDWWNKKYQGPNWQQLYEVVENLPYRAVDSKLQLPKRAVSFANVWMTCGATRETDARQQLLDLYIRKFYDPQAADPPGRRRDKSGDFSYKLPPGCQVIGLPQVPHDVVLLPGEDSFKRNIIIVDQSRAGSLAELKAKYDRDLPKALRDFEPVASELVALGDHREVARIVHTNTNPGVPVRQRVYILDIGAKRFLVTGTLPAGDDDEHDQQIDELVSSIRSIDSK